MNCAQKAINCINSSTIELLQKRYTFSDLKIMRALMSGETPVKPLSATTVDVWNRIAANKLCSNCAKERENVRFEISKMIDVLHENKKKGDSNAGKKKSTRGTSLGSN